MTAIEKIENDQETVNIDGLEQIFQPDNKAVDDRDDSDTCSKSAPRPNETSNTVTPEEAALAMGKSARTVRRMLEKGLIPGFKVTGKKRDEWRIPIEGITDKADSLTVIDADTVRHDDRLVIELHSRIEQLEAKLQTAQREVQAAAYRNGYLEAQAEVKDQQIKLLTDSQHKQGWWARFSTWFFKAQ